MFQHLARYDLVMPSKRHGLRMILDDHAASCGIELKPRLELDTLSALGEVVASTDLVTVLPTIALHQALAAGKVRAHHFSGPGVTRSIAWVHHPRRVVSAAASAVVDIVRQDLLAAAATASAYVHPAAETTARPAKARRRKRT